MSVFVLKFIYGFRSNFFLRFGNEADGEKKEVMLHYNCVINSFNPVINHFSCKMYVKWCDLVNATGLLPAFIIPEIIRLADEYFSSRGRAGGIDYGTEPNNCKNWSVFDARCRCLKADGATDWLAESRGGDVSASPNLR